MELKKIKSEPFTESKNTILLVGRYCNGAASCVNSIKRVTFTEHRFNPVECPGVGDRGRGLKCDMTTVLDTVDKIVKECGQVKAIVHVIKYGTRFAQQEKDAVEIVKLMFGPKVFSSFGVILITYGDHFDVDDETFELWCKEQKEGMKLLFQEVDNRIVSFNYITDDINRLNHQLDNLSKAVGEIEGHYHYGIYKTAAEGRRMLLLRETGGADHSGDEEHQNLLNKNVRISTVSPKTKKIIIITVIFLALVAIGIIVYFVVIK